AWLNSAFAQAPIVFAALCVLAERQRSLRVFASRQQIAEITGLQTKQLKNISRATRLLHEAGFVAMSSMRIVPESGGIAEVMEFRLLPGPYPLLPLSPLMARLGLKHLPTRAQHGLAQVQALERQSVAIWWALCLMASQSGTLAASFSRAKLTELTGLKDTTGERVGRALGALERCGWIRILRRAGRRGTHVVTWRIQLLMGGATCALAPVVAIDRQSAQQRKYAARARRKRKDVRSRPSVPTSAKHAHEIKINNRPRPTTEKDPSRHASGVARSSFLGRSRAQEASAQTQRSRLAAPSCQPELMRPRILDTPISEFFSHDFIEQPTTEKERTLHSLKGDLAARIELVDRLAEPDNPDHRLYLAHERKWRTYRAQLEDWSLETADLIDLLAYIRLAMNDQTPGAKPQCLKLRRRLVNRLIGRKANRRHRPIYSCGNLALVLAERHMGDPDGCLRTLSTIPSATVEAEATKTRDLLPSYLPRFHNIYLDSGLGMDSYIGRYRAAPDGAIDASLQTRSWFFDVMTPRDFARQSLTLRLQRLRDISAQALSTIATTLGIQLPDFEEFGLESFLHHCRPSPHEKLPFFLVPAIARVDTITPGANLIPTSEVVKMYRRARREYHDPPALGLVFRYPSRRLWVMHDAPQLRHAGTLATARLWRRNFSFESFVPFVRAAAEFYGWKDSFPPE
ncbi:MAG: hypothetical protein L6Q38_10210, partial [Nitrospira sp.]|nr:hypothetical protein [Nitrospira sp.]